VEFTPPQGINFSSAGDLPASTVSAELRRIASFLQNLAPYANLYRYDDWWEHDGLHFQKCPFDFHGLFEMVKSPRDLLAAMPGDEDVFVGVSPEKGIWYLRFYLHGDQDGFELLGRFDVTVPHELAERFRAEVVGQMHLRALEQDADSYYRSIMS
jgi:hypothetical protein